VKLLADESVDFPVARRPKLLRITTVPISLKLLLRGQLSFFQCQGFEVLAVSADGPEIDTLRREGIPHETVHMTRVISPLYDLISLFKLISVIRKFKPHIVHTHTPKAGLLGMLAAWMCRVPARLHTVAGLPVMERTGFIRKLLVLTEKITYACATGVYPNSNGLKHFIETSIHTNTRLKIIGKGSSNGINTSYFSPSDQLHMEAQKLLRHGIKDDTIVFAFTGRIVRDKGINELLQAFDRVSRQLHCKLLLAGPFEDALDPISDESRTILDRNKDVITLGYIEDVRPLLLASDVFVFPSYREGFPNVVMQACCMGCACIVSDINGCNEIIANGETGLVVKPKSADELMKAMVKLAKDPQLRKIFSGRARKFVVENFDQEFVWREMLEEYNKLLSSPKISSLYRQLIKPFFDFITALLLLVVTSPLLIPVIITLAIVNKGKVWFTQPRPGLHDKVFTLIKLKTMTGEKDEAGNLLPDDKRLTAVGKFIRKTSIDELPQLFNVMKGDMSIVGPRPLLVEYLPLYTQQQRKRHQVKPGITGWAQVNGRNTVSWVDKFNYDIWYAEHLSFWLDIKILFLTVLKVLKAEGISGEGSVSMKRFRGEE
jgi:lipopolysaccharide/colanic/teichoic acid biosynthesis glycosyltransferase